MIDGINELEAADVTVREREDGRDILLSGHLTVGGAPEIDNVLRKIETYEGERLCFCLQKVKEFDTAGAWLLYRTMRDLRFAGAIVSYKNITEQQERLMEQALINDAPCEIAPPEKNVAIAQIEDVGVGTLNFLESVGSLLAFLGIVMHRLVRAMVQPRRLRWTSLIYHLEQTGWKALPIVGLLCFLIGLVIVQQGAQQLRLFGADVFVVNLIGVSALRELGVLLTAIIIAGRSGSAFTAQIGSMKLQEEIDALRTIGLDPIETLVLPRMLALVIMMPILTVYADVMTLAGGALWSWLSLDITPSAFINRLQDAVYLADFRVGIVKAPVFGIVIAVAGCFNGLAVSGGATGVGKRTTQAVVQSIFMVIVLDAFFAIFFSIIGW